MGLNVVFKPGFIKLLMLTFCVISFSAVHPHHYNLCFVGGVKIKDNVFIFFSFDIFQSQLFGIWMRIIDKICCVQYSSVLPVMNRRSPVFLPTYLCYLPPHLHVRRSVTYFLNKLCKRHFTDNRHWRSLNNYFFLHWHLLFRRHRTVQCRSRRCFKSCSTCIVKVYTHTCRFWIH